MGAVDKYDNLLYILKEVKTIDHNVIAINLYNKYGNSSSIKIGSYDPSAIDPGFNNNLGLL